MKKLKIVLIAIFLAAAALFAVWYVKGCHIPVLFPKGLVGIKERDLLVDSTLLMLIVVIPVFILTFVFAWKYRASNKKATYRPDWDFSWLAETVWIGIPLIIITILSVMVWKSSHELDPYKPLQSTLKPVTIQVVSLPWKWLFIYPDQKVACINYIKVPLNTPIHFDITADSAMNSFWIPELGGQVFAMPGMKTQLHLIADKMGCFFGTSANLSGKGFSGMTFTVQAVSQGDFEQWIEAMHRVPDKLSQNSYKILAKPSEYNREASFVLQKDDLFDSIVMKYMMPEVKGEGV